MDLLIGFGSVVLAGWWIAYWAPDQWWKEVGLVGVIGVAAWKLVGWISGSKKLGGVITAGVVGLLMLNRFGILDPLSGVLLAVFLGLITLVI